MQKLGTIGGLVVGATLVLLPTQAQAQIQRSFINPSFELPTFGSAGQQCYVQVLPSVIPGWETTHGAVQAGSGNCSGYTSPGNVPLIEIWTTGFSGVSTATTPTSAGNQFAELNAEQTSQLYQNLCLYQGETISFSLLHRGRGSTTIPDVANFLIGLYTDSASKVFGTFSTTSNGTVTAQPVAQNGATIPAVTNNNAGNGWVRYNGTVPYTGTTGNQPVGFAAVSTGSGNNTVGNFLDNVQFSGNPVVELAASSGGGAETETNPTTNPPKIRIVGLVPAGGLSIPITVGGTATLGTDYNTSSGTSTFNMTIPAGNYDGSNATSLFTVPFTVISNNISQGSRTITFTIQPSPSFFTSSTTTCGGSPIITSTYTIYDDDIGGTIFNDIDGSKIQNGAETGTNAGGLNAVLINSSNQVVATTPVAANGTYLFSNASAGTYTVEITTATATVGAAPPAVTLPSGWVSTGENLSGAIDGTVDGKVSISVGSGTVTGVNFGIEQRPTAVGGTATSQANPGGTNTVAVASTLFTGSTDPGGTVASYKITAFPSNATSITINGTNYTSASFPVGGVTVTTAQLAGMAVDPVNGSVTVGIPFQALDNAGQLSSNTATASLPFAAALLNVSGTVFDDADADVISNGSDGTNAGSASLTIYAVDGTGKVVDKASVAIGGTYSLTNIPQNASVTLRLSNDSTVAIGATAPTTATIPSGWYFTGENKNGTVDGTIATLGNIALTTTTSNVSNQNFGIRQPYTIAPDPAPTTCNPDYRTALNTGISSAGGQLAVGANDLNWTAEWIAGPASGIGTPYATPRPVGPMPAVVVGNLAPGAWVNEPSNVRWISYPFRLSVNSNGVHNNADLDGFNGEDGSGNPIQGATSDAVRLKFTSTLTLPSNANTIAVSIPIGVAMDNQFLSIKVNGVENLASPPAPNSQAAQYGSLQTVNITQGWQVGVNTIEVILDSGPPLAGFFLGVQAATTQVCSGPTMLLVKRITAINGTSITTTIDDPGSTNDNAAKWPNPVDGTSGISSYLKGVINGGATQPGDLIEYTIYFLSNGGAAATNINLCDLVPSNSTFVPGSFSSAPASGINLTIGAASTNLTNVPDADGGQFFNPGATPSVACAAANTNGAVVVNVVKSPANLPNATAPGTPNNSYGFIRFRARIN